MKGISLPSIPYRRGSWKKIGSCRCAVQHVTLIGPEYFRKQSFGRIGIALGGGDRGESLFAHGSLTQPPPSLLVPRTPAHGRRRQDPCRSVAGCDSALVPSHPVTAFPGQFPVCRGIAVRCVYTRDEPS